mmetsp:Transcript_12748/g.19123  ORF Transcript_12748/g.19123 Transcript_12748/m.19123 type:complete len:151 (-) Transcript_12748:691-1143(-)
MLNPLFRRCSWRLHGANVGVHVIANVDDGSIRHGNIWIHRVGLDLVVLQDQDWDDIHCRYWKLALVSDMTDDGVRIARGTVAFDEKEGIRSNDVHDYAHDHTLVLVQGEMDVHQLKVILQQTDGVADGRRESAWNDYYYPCDDVHPMETS